MLNKYHLILLLGSYNAVFGDEKMFLYKKKFLFISFN